MPRNKRSFFERLTGSIHIEDDGAVLSGNGKPSKRSDWMEADADEGQLLVDVHQTPDAIIVKTMVAGVKPEDLQITISREMVTIQGKRQAETTALENDYFHKELYWGTFSRSILLPQEVDAEAAEATEKQGLLTIRLPKIDKQKIQKVKVKSS